MREKTIKSPLKNTVKNSAKNSVTNKMIYAVPLLLGLCFCYYYLRLSTDNVAFSDYIRLINSYLPDVDNPAKFFVPDILTRVPITYLGRLINVRWFGYNTQFDILLGLLSFVLGAAVLAAYVFHVSSGETRRRYRWYIWYLIVLVIYFGLNKWEMLTNGTGWVCFLSISGFYYHYLVLDRAVRTGHESRKDRIVLFLLPSVLTLLVAGPYCGGYSAILFLAYLGMLAGDYRKHKRVNRLYLGYLLAVLIPLGLYLWSNSYAVYVHRGAVEGSLIGTFLQNPLFFVKFILRALASAALGAAQLDELNALNNGGGIFFRLRGEYLLGIFVAALYLYALYLNLRWRIWEKTVFPLLLILSGGLNHLLIVASRWIFLNTDYGRSSRYEIQYQMGLIGILLTFAICWELFGKKRSAQRSGGSPRAAGLQLAAIFFGTAVLLTGSLYSTKKELQTAPFRKIYLEGSRQVGLNYRAASDEELESVLQHDADEIRKAMEILEENHLNIFRK